MKTSSQEARIENVYRLEGRVPISKAIPFGLQHVLAIFVANVAPLIIISSVAVYQGKAFTAIETARLLQNCMLIAGIGTHLQLYPIWEIGSGLPVVMGISFTFLAACLATASQDYGIMVGAIIVGGLFEGVLGLTAKYWRKIISPIVSACVVVSIGLSILKVGVSSFGSSSAYPLGSWQNLLVATITLAAALIFHTTLKGVAKQLYVLLGMAVGYAVSIFFGMVDFAAMAIPSASSVSSPCRSSSRSSRSSSLPRSSHSVLCLSSPPLRPSATPPPAARAASAATSRPTRYPARCASTAFSTSCRASSVTSSRTIWSRACSSWVSSSICACRATPATMRECKVQ